MAVGILLPFFYQQTKFHRHILICGWDITTSGLEKNNLPPYWNSTSGFDFDHITVLGMSLYIRLPNFVQNRSILSGDMMLYWFSRWRPLQPNFTSGFRSGGVALFRMQNKFRSYNSIRGWDITISVFEKQTSAIFKFHFRFRFRPYHRSWHVILHQSANFIQIEPPTAKWLPITTSYKWCQAQRILQFLYFFTMVHHWVLG